MIHHLTVWGSNSNRELNIPERLGQPVGLNSNLVSGYRDISKFYLGARHGIASKPSSQNYFKPLYSGNIITGYEQIIIPINTTWGDNTFFQLLINRTLGNLTFYYDKFDLGNDTTYAIDAQLGLIHGFGFDLMFSDIFKATGQIVNWTLADFDSKGIPPGNLALYPRGFKDVKAGDGYVLALNSGNKITGWGNSGHPVISGQKYSGINTSGNIKEIAAGRSHALVLFNNGFISGWGDNSLGQLNFNNPMLKSGVKLSTKLDYNLALGFKAPLITRITGNTNMRFDVLGLGSFDPNRQITGLEFQFSLDRKNWESYIFPTGLNSREIFTFTGNNFPTGNSNYYVRMKERYNIFCESLGWESILFPNLYSGFGDPSTGNATLFLDGKMSSDGRIRLSIAQTGNFLGSINRAFLSYDYGRSWSGITGFEFNDDYQSRLAMSSNGQVMSLISNNRLFISYNSGYTWSGASGLPLSLGNSQYSAVDISSNGRYHAIYKNFDTVYLSSNSGITWSGNIQLSGEPMSIRSLALSADGRNQIMCREAFSSSLWISNNSGFTWFSTNIQDAFPRHVDISDDGRVQAVITSDEGVFISYNSGSTFIKTTNSSLDAGRGISMSANGQYICAVGDQTPIALSSDSGRNWQYIPLIKQWFTPAISNNGQYIMVLTRPEIEIDSDAYSLQNCTSGTVFTNLDLENIGFNVGSTSLYNPNQNKFDIWTDYRVFGWGGGDNNVARIPNKLANERVLDIAAGYNNNIILTENPIAEDELKIIGTDISKFLDSNVLVSGGGLAGINKTFFLDGESNDRPLYRLYTGVPARSTDIVIFWNNTQWGLYSGLSNLIYYSLSNVEYPWLGEWQGDNSNFYPVPSILEVPSFIEETPPPCSGFIFDIA